MAIRTKGNGYQVDVTFKGQRAPRVSVSTLEEARRVEAQFIADLRNGRVPSRREASAVVVSTDIGTLGALFDYACRKHWSGMKSYDTQVLNASQCVEVLGARTMLRSITTADIDKLEEAFVLRGNAPGTINRKLISFRVMLKIAVEMGELDKMPRIKLKKEYEGRLRWFTAAEEQDMEVFFANDSFMADLITCGLDLGYRQAELLKLEVRDWNPETGLVHLWETKGDKARANPATTRVTHILHRRCRGRKPTEKIFDDAVSRTEISRRFRRWKDHYGLPEDDEACFHTTRHTCATRLVMRRVPLPVVQKWMGHADIQTTMKYAHLAPDSLDIAKEALEVT